MGGGVGVRREAVGTVAAVEGAESVGGETVEKEGEGIDSFTW